MPPRRLPGTWPPPKRWTVWVYRKRKLVQEAKNAAHRVQRSGGPPAQVAEQIADIERQQTVAVFPTTAPSGDIDDPNWRGRATASLLYVQEQLSAMPQELAAAQESAAVARKAAENAIEIRTEATNASLDRQAMLMHSAELAERDAKDATDRFQKVLAPVSRKPRPIWPTAWRPSCPKRPRRRNAITGPLAAALNGVQSAIQKTDENAVNAAGADVRKAIDQVQKELVRARIHSPIAIR